MELLSRARAPREILVILYSTQYDTGWEERDCQSSCQICGSFDSDAAVARPRRACQRIGRRSLGAAQALREQMGTIVGLSWSPSARGH